MACQASFVHGMLQARILEWGCHFLLQGDLRNPGIKPGSPALQADASPSEPPRKSSSLANTGDPNVHKTHLMPKKEITQGSSVPSSVFQQHGGCVEDGIEKESLFKKKVCPLPGRRIHKSTVTRVHGPGLGVRDCPAPSSIHGQVSPLAHPPLPPGHTAQVLRRCRAPPGRGGRGEDRQESFSTFCPSSCSSPTLGPVRTSAVTRPPRQNLYLEILPPSGPESEYTSKGGC